MSRRRYRYDSELKAVVEIGADWSDAELRAQTPTEQLIYGGAQTTDGVDISSRKKHREYLKATDSSMASDWTNTWAKAKAERNKDSDAKERREIVERAFYQKFRP